MYALLPSIVQTPVLRKAQTIFLVLAIVNMFIPILKHGGSNFSWRKHIYYSASLNREKCAADNLFCDDGSFINGTSRTYTYHYSTTVFKSKDLKPGKSSELDQISIGPEFHDRLEYTHIYMTVSRACIHTCMHKCEYAQVRTHQLENSINGRLWRWPSFLFFAHPKSNLTEHKKRKNHFHS